MAENVTRIQIETREGAGRLASETSRSEGVSKPGGQASEQAQRPPGIITSPESAKQSQLLQEASSQQSATLAKIESFLSSSSRFAVYTNSKFHFIITNVKCRFACSWYGTTCKSNSH